MVEFQTLPSGRGGMLGFLSPQPLEPALCNWPRAGWEAQEWLQNSNHRDSWGEGRWEKGPKARG